MTPPLQQELTKYLTDAHSIEVQALKQLERAPGIAEDPAFERALREHHRETEGHERRAAYDLLARTAERAGEPDVAETARAIRSEEWAMMERIEGLFDATVAASLAGVATGDMEEHLRRYLADAHALEQQSVQLLESGIEMAEGTALAAVFREHLDTTRGQRRRIEERLDALDASPSLLKDTALRLGALGWGMFFRAHPDTTAKLAAFAYAVEHLEIGGYEQLRRVAERAGDDGTVTVVSEILEEERRAARDIRATFEEALTAGLVEKES